MPYRHHVYFCVLVLILSACGGVPTPQNAPTPRATVVAQAAPDIAPSPTTRDTPPLQCPNVVQAPTEMSTLISTTVGDVVMSTHAPLYARLEDALRIPVIITNNGTQAVTIVDQTVEFGWQQPPADPNRRWYTQFFTLHPGSQIIQPGASTELAWHLDMEGDLEERGEIPIMTVRVAVDSTPASLAIPIYSQSVFGGANQLGMVFDAVIHGVVVDQQNQPLANVEITALLFSFKERIGNTRSDQNGRFSLCIPSQATLFDRLGQRPSAYPLVTYLTAHHEKGSYAMQAVDPTRDQTLAVTIQLNEPASTYTLTELDAQRYTTNHGWFWIQPLADGFAFTEARHPPELHQPGQVAVATTDHTWSTTTADECWGFDVSSTGLVAASCHDGSITVWQHDGTVLWQRTSERAQRSYNRHVQFSPDGRTLITGPLDDDAELLNAQTGQTIWSYTAQPPAYTTAPEHLRNTAFSPDGSVVTLGFAGGWLVQLDASTGNINWQGGYIGEFPLSLSVALDGTSYAIGKGRELVAIDQQGQLLWKTSLYEAVTTASLHALSADTIFGHTVNGSIWAVDRTTGSLRWWRKVGGGDGFRQFAESSGHNALDIDINRGLIAHAQIITPQDGGGSVVNLFTFDGVLLDSFIAPDAREQAGERVDHQIRGAVAVAFHPDGRLGVAYGDGFIRVFAVE